jgi:hypothetical protein
VPDSFYEPDGELYVSIGLSDSPVGPGTRAAQTLLVADRS